MVVTFNPNCSAACHMLPQYVCGGDSVTRVNHIYLYMFHIPCKKFRGGGAELNYPWSVVFSITFLLLIFIKPKTPHISRVQRLQQFFKTFQRPLIRDW